MRVCGLYRSQQGLSQGPFPYASDRSISKRDGGSSTDELFGCLSMIPPDTLGTR